MKYIVIKHAFINKLILKSFIEYQKIYNIISKKNSKYIISMKDISILCKYKISLHCCFKIILNKKSLSLFNIFNYYNSNTALLMNYYITLVRSLIILYIRV
jgi:hypothetical protein